MFPRRRLRRRQVKPFSVAQIRAACGLLGWSAEQLAARAQVEPGAITECWAGEGELGANDRSRINAVLATAGVIPLRADWAGEGVRFKRSECLP